MIRNNTQTEDYQTDESITDLTAGAAVRHGKMAYTPESGNQDQSSVRNAHLKKALHALPTGGIRSDFLMILEMYGIVNQSTVCTFSMLVVPDTPSGIPAVITARSPAFTTPASFALATAWAKSSSVLCISSHSTGVTPQLSAS